MKEEEVCIEDLFKILKRRWRSIAIFTLTTTIIAVIINFFVIKPIYEVSTKIFIGKSDFINQNYNSNDIQMYQNLLKTYSEVIRTNDLIQAAFNENNIDLDSEIVLKDLKVIPTDETQILEIGYKNENKYLCKDIVYSITNEFIKKSKELIPNGTVKIVENVKLPEYPTGPKKIMNISISFLAGLILSIMIELLKEYLDNSLKSKEQLEKIIQIPVIGVIPIEE